MSPRYIGSYEILQRVGEVDYKLALPVQLASTHPVFHVSMLRKCIGDPSSVVPFGGLGITNFLSYEEVSV